MTTGAVGGILAALAACLLAPAPARSGTSPLELHVRSSDGTRLAGSLHLPGGPAPYPAVVFTHGAEPGTRKHAGYLRWARSFQERGIAALVFDKRGCGDSEGTYVEAPDLTLPADDVIAWAEALAGRDDIQARRIGVLGWSQGGWVGPLAASRSRHLAFVVSISGPGVSPLEQNIFDKTHQFAATGASPERVAQFESVIRRVWTHIVTGTHEDEAQAAWDAVADASWFKDHYNGPPMMDRATLLAHPRMTHFVPHSRYDPVPTLEKLRVPLLAVFGEADTVVPVEASVAAMQAAFARSGNDGLTCRVYPGADHGVRVRGADGDLVPVPGFVEGVVEWVVEAAGRPE